jgi:hypothetical protein
MTALREWGAESLNSVQAAHYTFDDKDELRQGAQNERIVERARIGAAARRLRRNDRYGGGRGVGARLADR